MKIWFIDKKVWLLDIWIMYLFTITPLALNEIYPSSYNDLYLWMTFPVVVVFNIYYYNNIA